MFTPCSVSRRPTWAEEEGAEEEPREPSEGTVKDRLRRFRQAEGKDTWTLAKADPAEVAAVMPVLGAVVRRTEGRVTKLTRRQAQLVCRICAAAPGLAEDHPWFVYRFALAYQRREAAKEKTDDLDAVLALAPWRSREAREQFTPFAYGLRSQWVTAEVVPLHTPRQPRGLFRADERDSQTHELFRTVIYKAAVAGLWLVEQLFQERQGFPSSEDTEEAEDGTQR